MKKVLLFVTAIIMVATVFSSCKKDKETVAQKLQHKWTFLNQVDNSHDAGGEHISTIQGAPGDFFNFSSDGTFTSLVNGTMVTSTYSLISDVLIAVNNQLMTIKALTDTQFVLYALNGSATVYNEFTINLER